MAANGGPLKKRDRLMMTIQGRLYEAGVETHKVILEASLDPDKMQKVFEALSIEPKDRFDEQLDAIAYFIATAGEPVFLKRIKDKAREGLREQFSKAAPEVYKPGSKKESTPGEAPKTPPPAPPPVPGAAGAGAPPNSAPAVFKPNTAPRSNAPAGNAPAADGAVSAPAGVKNPPPPPSQSRPKPSGPTRNTPATFVIGGPPPAAPLGGSGAAKPATASAPSPPSPPAASAAPAAAPVAAPVSQPAPEPDPNRPHIKTPTYEGPCRRVGPVDRRSHDERRKKLESVMKNRRFHGQRRKQPMGRRSGDAERNKQFYKPNALAGVVQVPIPPKR